MMKYFFDNILYLIIKKKLSIFLMIQCNKYLREYLINNISKVYIYFVQPIFCYFIIIILYKNIQMIFWQYIVSYYKKKLSIFLMIQYNKYVKEYLINNISKVYIHFVQPIFCYFIIAVLYKISPISFQHFVYLIMI